MKKNNLFKSVLLLFAILTFTNCEENGPIQFIVIDDFNVSVNIKNQATESSFSETEQVNISELIDNASSFVAADVESIKIELDDNFSGTSINGVIKVASGSTTLFSQTVALTKNPTEYIIPANASNILSLISAGSFPITVTGTSTAPLGDNDFKINLTIKVKATVE